MTIEQLETLVLLSRLRNFRKVASKLGVSQPAISTRMRQLERELGVTLLERTKTYTELTPIGYHILNHAIDITDKASLLRKAASEGQSNVEALSMAA